MARRTAPARARGTTRRRAGRPPKPAARPEHYTFDRQAADRIVRFFETCLVHVEGPKAGERFRLERWQRKILRHLFGWKRRSDRARRFRIAFLAVPRKNGKALAIDTPIPTPAGWARMGELRVGDTVFDDRGQPTRILATGEVMHDRPCFRVSFCDGSHIVADADHLWRTETRRAGRSRAARGPLREVDHLHTTAEIRETLWTGGVKPERNHQVALAGALATPPAELPVPPYTLGAWLGDGTSSSATISCPPSKREILKHIEAEGISVATLSRLDMFRLGGAGRSQAARDGSLQATLRRCGLLGQKHIPAPYLRASPAQRLALLQGLMDTDGSCSAAGQCAFGSTCRALALGTLELLRSLGFKPTIREVRARLRGRDCGPAWRIQFWAYADRPVFRLAHKRARQKPAPSSPTRASSRKIIAVDPVPSVPVRCIAVDSPSHLYLAGEGMVPTHNTSFAAGIALYLLAADGEIGGQVFSAAADKTQAAIVFEIAKKMVEASPALSRRIQVFRRSLVHPRTGSSWRVLSADVKTKAGLNASGVIFDELHTQPTRDLYDTLKGSTSARRQPLTIYLTTAGHDRTSICFEEWEYARAVRDGAIEDRRYYPVIYEAAEKDDWRDPRVWRRANPNLGVSKFEDVLAADVAEAERRPNAQNRFRREELNIWTENVSAWLDLTVWGKAPPPLAREALRAIRGYGGLDLSSNRDLTAFALIFPPEDLERGVFNLLLRFWVPEEQLALRVKRDRVPYDAWVRDGFVTATPGAVVDHARVRTEILELAEEFQIAEIAYDPWGGGAIRNDLEAEGLTMVQVAQNLKNLSAPSKAFEGLVVSRRLAHGGNPVLFWNAQNVVVYKDVNENIRPDKKRSRERIDGIVASVLALDRAQRHEPAPAPSAYETEGLLTL